MRELLDLDDQLLTLKPTPNRGDCLSLLGVAREVAAVSGAPLRMPEMKAVRPSVTEKFPVALDAPQACPRYCGRLVRGVNARAATPEWMVRRLARSGIRSISALVDITNYVMLELGQPLHAFDFARLEGGIRVRFAKAGEKLTLLNGSKPELGPDYLVIADERKAVALAGIMGGLDTAVGDATREVFLESAFFAPDVIAGKSRAAGFRVGLGLPFRARSRFRWNDQRPRTRDPARHRNLRRGRGSGQRSSGAAARARSGAIEDKTRRAAARHPPRTGAGERYPAAAALRVLGGGRRIPGHAPDVPLRHRDRRGSRGGARPDPRLRQDSAATPTAPAIMLPVEETRRDVSALRTILVHRDYQEIVSYSFVDAAVGA